MTKEQALILGLFQHLYLSTFQDCVHTPYFKSWNLQKKNAYGLPLAYTKTQKFSYEKL